MIVKWETRKFVHRSIPVTELEVMLAWYWKCEQEKPEQTIPQSAYVLSTFPKHYHLFLCTSRSENSELTAMTYKEMLVFFFISLISSTGLLLSDLGRRCYTRTHFRFRMSLQSHGFNTPIRKEENICFLHRSMKFMQEDFLVINKNHALWAFNVTVPSKKNPTIK